MPKVANALISFIDGSFLFVELSKKMDHASNFLYCLNIIGTPEGTPADKPTIANSILRQYKAGKSIETVIPISRINAISIQEEFIGKDVPSDMKTLWG